MAADNGLTTPALMVNEFGHASKATVRLGGTSTIPRLNTDGDRCEKSGVARQMTGAHGCREPTAPYVALCGRRCLPLDAPDPPFGMASWAWTLFS
jgi:hypothetical protein